MQQYFLTLTINKKRDNMHIKHKELKDQQRKNRENYHINLGLRVHRALSWLERSEQCIDDFDARFIFLWISFNAAYSNETHLNQRISEQETFHHFFERLCDLDSDKQQIYHLIWNEFTGSIRILLDNKYVFQPFWDYHNKIIDKNIWQEKFTVAKASANKALSHKNTPMVLSIIFSRLYTLRNQTLHGGATWNSSINREQMRDAVNILKKIVPIIIKIMMDNHSTMWGEPCYPVINTD